LAKIIRKCRLTPVPGPTVIADDLGKINGCRYQIISMGESVIRPVRWAAG
jgi:hypothetical protein